MDGQLVGVTIISGLLTRHQTLDINGETWGPAAAVYQTAMKLMTRHEDGFAVYSLGAYVAESQHASTVLYSHLK